MIPVWGVKEIPCLRNVLGVVVMVSFFLFHIRASQVYLHAVAPTLAIRSSPTSTTYVKKGEILTLNVSFIYTGNRTVRVQWTKGEKGRIIEIDAAGCVNKFDDRASIRDSASLVLTNTTVADSESYISTINAGDVEGLATEQYPVIITEQPTAKTNCSNMTVDRGKYVTCRCFSISGNPPPTTSWSKSGVTGTIGGEILSLKNVNARDSGMYVCKVQSHDLPDQVSISVKVKSAPSVTSVEADTEEAIGFPKPTYTNGATYTIKGKSPYGENNEGSGCNIVYVPITEIGAFILVLCVVFFEMHRFFQGSKNKEYRKRLHSVETTANREKSSIQFSDVLD